MVCENTLCKKILPLHGFFTLPDLVSKNDHSSRSFKLFQTIKLLPEKRSDLNNQPGFLLIS